MTNIWKYPLEITDEQTISMPRSAWILSVQSQNIAVCLWALVDPSESQEPVTIRIIGTGNPIEHIPGQYLGTVQTMGGKLVWHVFVGDRR